MKKINNIPYSVIASIYDELMFDIDYVGWVDYILRIFRRYGIKGKTLLDIACGTGVAAGHFARYGYDVTGLDLSAEMLEVARERVQKKYPQTGFVQGDMTNFKLKTQFEAVICLYDSLNYLLKEKDLQKAYQCAYKHLRSGGLYVFDMNTEFALTEIWGEGTTVRETENLTSIWESTYNRKTKVSTLHLTFFALQENGYYLRGSENHEETFYSLDTIRELLTAVGFSGIEFFEHMTFYPPTAKTYRVMVVAQKEK